LISLRELKLRNFLSHRETEIPFTDETFVIVGLNASGKTSILRGIFFALFGEDLEGKKLKKESLINRSSNSASLSLTFVHRGSQYTVERVISVRRNEARLYREGSLVAEKSKEVLKYLQENLGLEPGTLKSTLFVPQGEITELFKGAPKERRQVLNRLLGLEEFGKKYEALNLKVKELKKIKELLEDKVLRGEKLREREKEYTELIKEKGEKLKELSLKREEVERELKELKEKLTELEGEKREFLRLKEALKHLEEDVERLRGEIERDEKRLEGLKKVRKRVELLKREVESLERIKELLEALRMERELKKELGLKEKELRELEERLKRLSEIGELLPDLEEREERLKREEEKLRREVERGREEIARLRELKREREKLVKEIEKLGKVSVRKVEEKLERAEEELKELRSLKAELGERLKEINRRGKLLKESSESYCPLCRRPLPEEEKEKLLNQMRMEFLDLKEKLKQVEKREKLLDEELKRLKRLFKEESSKEERLSSLRDRLKEIEEAIGGRSLKDVEERVKRAEKLWDEKRRELTKVQGNLQALTKEKERLEREVSGRSTEALSKEIEEIEREIEKLKEKWGEELKRELNEVEREYGELLRKERERSRLEGELKNEGYLRENIERKRRELKLKEKELKETGSKLKGLKFNQEYYDLLEKSVSEKEEVKEGLISETSRLKGELKQIEESLKRLKEEIEEVERERDALVKLRDSLLILEKLSLAVHPERGFLTLVRRKLLPQIERYAKELFELFGFEFSRIKIDEDLSVKVIVPGVGELSLEELSGGQQIAFALALRFAMAKQFSKVSLKSLILDEPTIHLDRERRIALTELLMKLKGAIPQMVIVTHDSELEVVADRVIKVKKVGGFSEVEVD